MLLTELKLTAFRCVERFEASIPQGRVLIIGDNASGKTTLLEAIYYLATGRSFRTRSDAECIPWGRGGPDAYAVVRGKIKRRTLGTSQLLVSIGNNTKSVRIDEQPLRQLGDLWGRMNAVLFTPDDLQLVKGGPSERRRYLDIALSQISRPFLDHLQRYTRALRQRNALLRNTRHSADEIRPQAAPWNAQLAQHGIPILRERQQFITALEQRARAIYADIVANHENETLGLRYQHFLKNADLELDDDQLADDYRQRLERGLDDDLRRGQTSLGPHRDEMLITLSGQAARDYASQGQSRSCALALRLAEVHEMQNRTGEAPVVLLDDLASELDPDRKRRVLELLQPEWQTFLTTTRRADFAHESTFNATIEFQDAGVAQLHEEETA